MTTNLQLRAARVLGWMDVRALTDPRRDPNFLAFVRTQPCLAEADGECAGKKEAHHEPPKSEAGGSLWNDRKTVCLCRWHHQDGPHSRHYGLGNREAFELHHGIDFWIEETRINEEYEAQGGQTF